MITNNLWPVVAAVLVLGLLTELAALLTKSATGRRIAVYVSVVLNGFGAGLLIVAAPHAISIILAVLTFYRVLNLLRFIAGRLPDVAITKIVGFASVRFLLLQVLITGGWLAVEFFALQSYTDSILLILGAFTVGVCLLILMTTALRIPRASLRRNHRIAMDHLPTVSVLIPARNETADLTACIETVLANDYPKLEVLVLDDCSQDNTPHIIKQYAQQGVRFIAGEKPKGGWLAKNQAYERLRQEATGELLLFIGVDVRLHGHSIQQLVQLMQSKKLAMLSVMPRRGGQKLLGMLVQPMRYWWELALPKHVIHMPPVLSTVWMIRAKELKSYGGLAGFRRSVLPEAHFAKRALAKKRYAFVRTSNALQVETLKTIPEQIDTAIRTRYPQVKRDPFNAMLVAAFQVGILLTPLIIVIYGVAVGERGTLWYLAVIASAAYALSHIIIAKVSNPGLWWVSLISWPFITLYELLLLHISFYRYEFGIVEWKSRNICLPVMQVIPKLPELPQK